MTPPCGLRDKHECNITDEHFITHSAHTRRRREDFACLVDEKSQPRSSIMLCDHEKEKSITITWAWLMKHIGIVSTQIFPSGSEIMKISTKKKRSDLKRRSESSEKHLLKLKSRFIGCANLFGALVWSPLVIIIKWERILLLWVVVSLSSTKFSIRRH